MCRHDVEQTVLVQIDDGDAVHAPLDVRETRHADALEELAAPRASRDASPSVIFFNGGSPGRCSAISSLCGVGLTLPYCS